jgi:hypothetical protein
MAYSKVRIKGTEIKYLLILDHLEYETYFYLSGITIFSDFLAHSDLQPSTIAFYRITTISAVYTYLN